MRILLFLISLGICIGCYKKPIPPVPVLRPISKISATLHDVPNLGVAGIPSIDIPSSELSNFANLVTPQSPCKQKIDKMDYHIADIFVQHTDGTSTKLMVRWTGHNPAAISLNDEFFFYGGMDEFPDGGTRIIRLLNTYHFESIK